MRGGKRISSTIGEALIDVVHIAGFEWSILYGISSGGRVIENVLGVYFTHC